MSPRQFGKVDVSVSWSPCGSCPHRHPSTAPCPPPSGVWLVLAFCHRCKPKGGQYCSRHGGHRVPQPEPAEAHHTLPDDQEEHRRRAGEKEGA
ncbi:hypothetical protein [Actinoplanes sp. NPDC049118]|uniref:hypothetical protein n=1 Tax=Actinoplanes sp. NPDC049118 TaxID=3155769 RepID=UPI0033E771A0